jgi:Icc-related predicted phosphoesterase
MVLLDTGEVFVFGFNRHGRLGLALQVEKLVAPLRLPFPVKVARVACGFGHSAMVSREGALYVWGHSGDGALGLGFITPDVTSPTVVTSVKAPFADVSCGGSQTLALTVAGVLYCAGTENALGPDLAGTVFKSWEDEGEVTLARAGSKSCIVVTEGNEQDFFLFGTAEFNHDEPIQNRKPQNPTLFKVGTEGRVVDAGSNPRMAIVLDELGYLYVWKKGVWQRDSGVRNRISHIAVGVLSVVLLESESKQVLSYSGAASEPTPVAGLSACMKVFAGHRTMFAVARKTVTVVNRDGLGKLRGACGRCGDVCPRFAGATNLTMNSPAGLACLRCGCDALTHKACEEVRIEPPVKPRPALQISAPSTSASSSSPLVEWAEPREKEEEIDESLPLEECKRQIRAIQEKIRVITVPSTAGMRVFAVSDVHTDFKGNMLWLEELVQWAQSQFKNDVLIVAGDISHDTAIVERTLTLFTRAFGHVFHVCGNHELWVVPKTPTVKHAYHKLHEIQEMCVRLGVNCSPVIFQSAEKNEKSLVVCPLLTWYEPQFAGRTTRGAMEGFDMACRWMETDQQIATFLLSCNALEKLEKLVEGKEARVVTFSHFLPREELFFGWPALREVMGCVRIDEQVRSLKSQVHVFGHSHMDVDRVSQGIRYVQHALGSEPRHRTQSSFPHYKPKQVL